MDSSQLQDIFELLTLANELEESGTQVIEAATKYYEAVYLIRTYLQRLPLTASHADTRRLLTEKAAHYEAIAKELLSRQNGETSSDPLATHLTPRSPVAKETFLGKESPVVPDDTPAPPSARLVHVQALAAKANHQLSHALDLDEQHRQKSDRNVSRDSLIKAYMEAAELYLSALRQAKEAEGGSGRNSGDKDDDKARMQPIASLLERRLEQTLDHIDELKKQECAIHELLPTTSMAHTDKHARLLPEEIQVLKRSSLMVSGLFLPWSDDEAMQLCREAADYRKGKSSPSLFTDPQGTVNLNPRQREHFFKWARPDEIVNLRRRYSRNKTSNIIHVVESITPYSIQQKYVTDCSFIASLCICAATERRFGEPLISSMLYPQLLQNIPTDNGSANRKIMPIMSPSGKYMVKIWLNGVARAVVIDDLLPIDKYGNLLCSTNCGSSSLELWVSLIEKAYMKLCGGYDFAGSNSGVDLFSLTGWIPERILFAQDSNNVKDFETAPERVWDRIYGASTFGDCLITVSTDAGASDKETVLKETGLVTGHAYAVLNVCRTKNGTRLLLLKNPWGRQEWNGKYSCYDTVSWTPSLCEEVGYKPRSGTIQEDGVFWIAWDDVLTHFQNFHLSWNPQLFRHRAVRHGFWAQGKAPDDDSFNIGENPQYIMIFPEAQAKLHATIWILVSRHVDKQEQEGSEVIDYLTVHLHRNSERRERIWYPGKPGNCVLTGAYTNNPHVLVRYDLQGPQDRYLSLVLSQYNKSKDLGYTLSCYSTEPFTLTRPIKEMEHMVKFQSQWTPSKSGGTLGTKYAHMNPQFAVAVPCDGAKIQISVTTNRTSATCFVLVPVASFGQTLTAKLGRPVIDTGKYRHGFVISERQDIDKGNYTLLVTNFDKGKLATFELQVSSTVPLRVQEIP